MAQCCACFGGIEGRGCHCKCHQVSDVRNWETIAFIWICDARDKDERRRSWERFHTGYPHLGFEDHDAFWERMLCSKWYRDEGYKHRHHDRDHDDDDGSSYF